MPDSGTDGNNGLFPLEECCPHFIINRNGKKSMGSMWSSKSFDLGFTDFSSEEQVWMGLIRFLIYLLKPIPITRVYLILTFHNLLCHYCHKNWGFPSKSSSASLLPLLKTLVLFQLPLNRPSWIWALHQDLTLGNVNVRWGAQKYTGEDGISLFQLSIAERRPKLRVFNMQQICKHVWFSLIN